MSSSLGSLEITNVHPGTNIYSSLNVKCSWLGNSPSLISIEVAGGPRVIGIDGIVTWPEFDMVCHNDIQQGVDIFLNNSEDSAAAIITDNAGDSIRVPATDGRITLSPELVHSATQNRLKITLEINSSVISSIKFLPSSESELFNFQGALNAVDGIINTSVQSAVCTDYIDISDVTDIAYNGALRDYQYARLIAYNENKQFVRVLIQAGSDSRHVVPSGDYKYVRACSNADDNPSLIIYFRDRG